ncbi:MAG: alpha/beta hydrolase [Dehalococcoidia bacterium]|nr:alpha/beta hydrolase [Dehalococcoidia bacterium]
MAGIQHRTIQTNGINMHIAEAGTGPLVIFCHGWPESWYSWRHQLTALAAAGFHAVAPDQRGYGQTDKPIAIDQYTQLHMVGDIVGLVNALDAEDAVIVGHDWGAPVAWNSAMMRPDLFRAVVGMSVPHSPRGPMAPTTMFKALFGNNFFYILYFQEPGRAEAEFEADVRKTMRMILFSASGDLPPRERQQLQKGAKFLDQMEDPTTLPPWLTEQDIDYYTGEFERSGFRGGLNWYRNMDRNWELTGAWHDAKITVPALFVAGDKDPVLTMIPGGNILDAMRPAVPGLVDAVLIPGAGHWVQQERPAETNAALISFLRSL